MKLTWKKNTANPKRKRPTIPRFANLPFDFQTDEQPDSSITVSTIPISAAVADKTLDDSASSSSSVAELANSLLEQGNQLAEEGRYGEALGKWENAITLMPEKAILHEQKSQVLLEIGDAWGALKAANRSTVLEPSWAEAWITLGRAQLNFGEPDSAIESFDRALALKPESTEAQDDRQAALHLVKRRKQLHTTGLSTNSSRFAVADKQDN
ncbi:hypothetical protein V2J09_007647 [Rumex salicifolius]